MQFVSDVFYLRPEPALVVKCNWVDPRWMEQMLITTSPAAISVPASYIMTHTHAKISQLIQNLHWKHSDRHDLVQ